MKMVFHNIPECSPGIGRVNNIEQSTQIITLVTGGYVTFHVNKNKQTFLISSSFSLHPGIDIDCLADSAPAPGSPSRSQGETNFASPDVLS